MNDRMGVLLPSVISQNQSGFVKGRSITENVLLAQEIISYISKRGKPTNVVIKCHDPGVPPRRNTAYLTPGLIQALSIS